MSVGMMVASLAALSSTSLPGIEEWPGIHWIKIEDEMELMKLRMKNVRGYEDLLSLQKSMVIE